MDNKTTLQISLLLFFQMGKPLRNAADSLEDWTRQEIIDMKNALERLDYIQRIPGMRTSGTMYRITKAGRLHLQQLQERIEA